MAEPYFSYSPPCLRKDEPRCDHTIDNQRSPRVIAVETNIDAVNWWIFGAVEIIKPSGVPLAISQLKKSNT
jgi:hypothetical protein